MNHIIVHPEFRPWEVTEATSRQELDLAMLREQPEISKYKITLRPRK